jgi:DNA-binding PadR family transcriptional regulator
MAAGAVNFRYLVLGLLAQKPMSGYDIKRVLKSLSWLIGDPSFGSLYPALHTLLKNDLVKVDIHPHQGKPPRKIYSIAEAGKQVLNEWINQPANSSAPLKAFVMRLILADNFSTANLIAHLQQRRAQVATYRATLKQTVWAADEKTDLKQHLALDYGLALATAELAWLDSTLNRLS